MKTAFGPVGIRAAMGGAAVAALLGACGGGGHKQLAAAPGPAATAAPTTGATTTTTTAAPKPTCPLTDTPPSGGSVPARPALAVKVENLPAARPQYGLGQADIVYEEPVEGGITRFVAIYQCHDSSRVEPVRSGRIIDPELVEQYGAHPLFTYSGAIIPAIDAIDSSPLVDVGANRAPAVDFPRDPSRPAPHNLMISTSSLYAYAAGLKGASTTPPPAPFPFSVTPDPSATPAASVRVGYEFSPVTWTWQPASGIYTRSYSDTGVANLGGGGQITASNVIVMSVVMYPSQYVEDATGSHENLLVLTGSGAVQVYRNGTLTSGTWNRASLSNTTSYLDRSGNPIPMSPGNTWIELVPTTVSVNATP